MTELQKAIQQSPVGKSLPQHFYVHRSSVCKLAEPLRLIVAQAMRVAGEFPFDVVKIAKDGLSVSLLRYPTFDTEAHPALEYSIRVYLAQGNYVITNYKGAENPPILHRKETFVDPSYPRYAQFQALTKQEEELGLLNRRDIGTKGQWQHALDTKKVAIKGHSIKIKQ